MTTAATREGLFAGLLAGLCDDAALFPPGNLPLVEAVPAHVEHLASGHRGLVGPFVVSAADVPALGALLGSAEAGSFEVAVTVPEPSGLAAALSAAAGVPQVRVVAVEVAVPIGVDPAQVVPDLDSAVTDRPDLEAYVELPRDDRRPALLAALAATRYHAKLRTGGVRADLYPDEDELAAAVLACVAAGVAFKATAGLHHAIRGRYPLTYAPDAPAAMMFGYLNIFFAAAFCAAGSSPSAVFGALEETDASQFRCDDAGVWWKDHVVIHDQLAVVRQAVATSFGSCSFAEPVQEAHNLHLI